MATPASGTSPAARRLLTIQGHNQDVLAATYSPGGARIATASADGNVMVWDARTGQAQWNLQGHGTVVRSVAFSPDSSLLASSGDDHMARIWEIKTGKLLLTLEDKAGGVRSVQFTPDGTRVIFAGGDGTARILLASVDGLLGFGCRVLRGTDLYPEITSYCDRFPDAK
jgi:WD40 repeat protein